MSFLTPRIISAAVSRSISAPFSRTFAVTSRWQNQATSVPPSQPPLPESAEPVSSIPSLSSFHGSTPVTPETTTPSAAAAADADAPDIIAQSFLLNHLPTSHPGQSSEPVTSESWWRDTYGHRAWPKPGNQFTGRAVTVARNSGDVATAMRRLGGILARNRIKRELKLGEYYEKPSERKKRLAVERHRRRFQDLYNSYKLFEIDRDGQAL
ncbi:hypothetical protein QFC21_003955 [Naganishia friedmannii]|uniref:Uncharacterized protein n=1 Tax=Naganishia friedmannii TaxID=89922 RepID=A0ACC2VN22_9TREE|nr:hypothetical protein QFC21_003955 [Naganishia friedmannii]